MKLMEQRRIDDRLEQISLKIAATRQFVVDHHQAVLYQTHSILTPNEVNSSGWCHDRRIIKLVFSCHQYLSPRSCFRLLFPDSSQMLAPSSQGLTQALSGLRFFGSDQADDFLFSQVSPERVP